MASVEEINTDNIFKFHFENTEYKVPKLLDGLYYLIKAIGTSETDIDIEAIQVQTQQFVCVKIVRKKTI